MITNLSPKGRSHHFVNLVSLRYHLTSFRDSQLYYVDTLSLSIVLKALGVPHRRISGVRFYQEIKALEGSYYLLPHSLDADFRGEVLPFLLEKDIDVYMRDLTERLDLEIFQRIIIGISSPRQDMLGESISKIYHGETYCLGAAIQYRKSRLIRVADAVGFTWLMMFIRSPYRTMKKISKTMIEVAGVILSKDYRDEIKKMNFQN